MPEHRRRRVTRYSATTSMRPDKRLRACDRNGGVGASPALSLLPQGSRHRVVATPWICPGYPFRRVGAPTATRWSLSAACLDDA